MIKFEVKLDSAAFKAAITGPARATIQDAMTALREQFKQLFSGPKTGRTYRKPGGGTYRASAPGEPPAIRTRNLLESISDSFPAPLTGQVTISAPYARDLDEGTGRVKARPFVRPAIESVTAQFNRGVRSGFQ